MRVLVSGTIDIAPEKRDQALLDAKDLILDTLDEPGCVAYNWSKDPFAPQRIHVFEEWESEQTLSDHLVAPTYTGMLAHLSQVGILGTSVQKYRVDHFEPVYDPEGVPRGDFFTDKK